MIGFIGGNLELGIAIGAATDTAQNAVRAVNLHRGYKANKKDYQKK